MQIQTIIDHIQSHTPWVDYRKTRDFILIDGGGSEVSQVAVCWVATMKVIEECIRQDIHSNTARRGGVCSSCHRRCISRLGMSAHKRLPVSCIQPSGFFGQIR